MFERKPLPFLFVDINTQRDFFDKGAPMAAANAQAVRRNISDLVSRVARAGLPVLAAADAHAPDDPEFAAQHLPPHALMDSEGQKKIFETHDRRAPIVPKNGRRRPWPKLQDILARGGQLILEKNRFDLFDNPAGRELVSAFRAKELILYGATLEQDVRATAQTARRLGWAVTVADDAVTTRSSEQARQARQVLRRRGVIFEPAEEIGLRVVLYQKRLEREKRRSKRA